MGKTTLVWLAPLLLLTCMVFTAMPGEADAISDTLTVFNPAGAPVQILIATESQEGDGSSVFFIGIASLADPAQFGNPLVLCEAAPCSAVSPYTNLSDMVGVIQSTIGGSTFSFLGFVSDGESGIGPGIEATFGGLGSTFMVEPNSPVDVTMYLNPVLRSSGWTATFVSDAEVPEPGSLAMLGTGLAGLFGVIRRKRNR